MHLSVKYRMCDVAWDVTDGHYESEKVSWSDEISLNYTKEHKSNLLLRCRDHMHQGITFRIMESQVVSLPPAVNGVESGLLQPDSSKKTKQGSGGTSARGATPVGKKEKDKGGGKGEKDKKGKGKSKSGHDLTADWVKQPPESRCLAEVTMVLDELLTGHGKSSTEKQLEIAIPKAHQQKGPDDGEQMNGEDDTDSSQAREENSTQTVIVGVQVDLKRHPLIQKLH